MVSEASPIDSSSITHTVEQERNGRPAMMVDGVMRWITEDGTPGDIVWSATETSILPNPTIEHSVSSIKNTGMSAQQDFPTPDRLGTTI